MMCENGWNFGRAEDRQGVSILRRGLERSKITRCAKTDRILGVWKIDRGCRFSADSRKYQIGEKDLYRLSFVDGKSEVHQNFEFCLSLLLFSHGVT